MFYFRANGGFRVGCWMRTIGHDQSSEQQEDRVTNDRSHGAADVTQVDIRARKRIPRSDRSMPSLPAYVCRPRTPVECPLVKRANWRCRPVGRIRVTQAAAGLTVPYIKNHRRGLAHAAHEVTPPRRCGCRQHNPLVAACSVAYLKRIAALVISGNPASEWLARWTPLQHRVGTIFGTLLGVIQPGWLPWSC